MCVCVCVCKNRAKETTVIRICYCV